MSEKKEITKEAKAKEIEAAKIKAAEDAKAKEKAEAKKQALKEKKTFCKRSGTVEIIGAGESKHLKKGKVCRVGLESAEYLIKKGAAKAK